MKFVRETHEKFDLIALDLNDPMGRPKPLLHRILPAAARGARPAAR